MYNWKNARNYRRFRDENGNVIANIICIDGEEVAVSDEVYEAYLDGYSGYSGVSEDAAAEILEKLMTHQQISSDEVAQILKRYGVCGEPEALQIAYRKKVGQRLIASLRDPYGRREVFSTGSTYVLVDCCNDRDALEHIHKKLDKDMEAVDQASCKIDNRLQVLQRFSRYRRKRR